MATPSVKQLRHRLEERRRRALGLVKALDRCGFSPDLLDASALHIFAERDGDCLVWLARLTSLPARSSPPPDWEDIPNIEPEMDQLEAAQVGMLVVEDDEIYDGIARHRH